MSAYIESTVAAALRDLDRALDLDAADAERQRHTLLAYERLRAVEQMLAVERDIAAVSERAAAYVRGLRPLRLVK